MFSESVQSPHTVNLSYSLKKTYTLKFHVGMEVVIRFSSGVARGEVDLNVGGSSTPFHYLVQPDLSHGVRQWNTCTVAPE